jgi:hypothetical protein
VSTETARSRRDTARANATTFAVVAGETCALIVLAPLEYRTGVWVGISPWIAWTITGVVYSVAALAIVTGRLLPAALGLVWLSGVVGAVHSASEQAASEHAATARAALAAGGSAPGAAASLDGLRLGTSIAVVSIVVLAMSAIWHLGRVAHRAQAAAAAESAALARADAERAVAEQERRTAAARAHQLEVARLAEERTRAARWAEQEAARTARTAELEAARLAHETELERARLAHEHEARMAELARAKGAARTARTPRATPRTEQPTARRAAAREQQGTLALDAAHADDLARRRRVREQWERREAAGRATPTRALARTLGISEGAARAQLSRWRAERAQAAEEQRAAVR